MLQIEIGGDCKQSVQSVRSVSLSIVHISLVVDSALIIQKMMQLLVSS